MLLAREVKKPDWQPSAYSIEGYLAARVVGEALKRAVKPESAASVSGAMEKMQRLTLGDIDFDFSGGVKRGSRFAEIGTVGASGKLMR